MFVGYKLDENVDRFFLALVICMVDVEVDCESDGKAFLNSINTAHQEGKNQEKTRTKNNNPTRA